MQRDRTQTDKTHDPFTYSTHTHQWEHMLNITLRHFTCTTQVQGKDVTFLGDCGVTYSVTRTDQFQPALPKFSCGSVKSVSASGDIVTERYTGPLSCTDPVCGPFKHSFILSHCCPVNLMGRDLMCRLAV